MFDLSILTSEQIIEAVSKRWPHWILIVDKGDEQVGVHSNLAKDSALGVLHLVQDQIERRMEE